MKLSELNDDKFLDVVLEKQELREKVFDFIYDDEVNFWIDNKLNFFGKTIKYELGICCPRSFSFDYTLQFVVCAKKCLENFGASSKLQKLCEHCYNLYGTNLFEHYVKKLGNLFYNEQIESTYVLLEDLSYAIYCQDKEKINDLYDLENIYMNKECFDNYFYDEYSGEVTKVTKVS